jgi:Flp pilus assembly protein TadG
MIAMMSDFLRPVRRLAAFLRDRRGVAAIEFAIFLPMMLLLFFGTVEFCSAVAIDRKVTLAARTLSDLTSQQPQSANGNTHNNVAVIVDSDLQNNFSSSIGIMASYDPSPTRATVSEVYVDNTGIATVQWSKAATVASGASTATLTASSRNAGDNVTAIIPTQLLVHKTYLIFSEISYTYIPTVGWVLAKTGISLSDVSYTRPRQALCITYNNLPALSSNACPQT